MSLYTPDSADLSYNQMLEDLYEATAMDDDGMSYCEGCDEYKSSTRTVRENGQDVERCRDCRPLDKPCEACGKDEHIDGVLCLACCIEGDLEAVVRERVEGVLARCKPRNKNTDRRNRMRRNKRFQNAQLARETEAK